MAEWIKIFALALQLFHKTDGAPNTSLVIQWDNLNRVGLHAPEGKQALFVSLVAEAGRQEICSYIFIPWQNIYESKAGNDSIGWFMYDIVTVNEFAIVYRSNHAVTPLYRDAVNKLDRYVQFFSGSNKNQTIVNEGTDVSSYDSIRYISIKEYPFYTVSEIALPGSADLMSEKKEIKQPGKMRYLILVPDQGPVKSSWIYCGPAVTDPCFMKNDSVFRDIFTRNIKHCLVDVNQKDNLLIIAQDEIAGAARDCDNGKRTEEFLNSLLRRLLNKKTREETLSTDDLFSDYQPKTTPDLATDYMYELQSEFRLIPDADTANIEDLIGLYNIYIKAAKRNPGKWEAGNMILGAKEKEYAPSKEELILNEIGERIRKVAAGSHPNTLSQVTKVKLPKQIRYKHFTYTHSDVMGSGRFFYVNTIEEVVVKLK